MLFNPAQILQKVEIFNESLWFTDSQVKMNL